MFYSFDEGDSQKVSFAPVAKQSLTAPTEGYLTPEQEAEAQRLSGHSALAAAFRETNMVGSALANAGWLADNTDDGVFDPATYVKEHNLVGFEDAFMGVLNQRKADTIRADIERRRVDQQTLAAAGTAGFVAQLAAGTFDLPLLIPGGTVARAGRTSWTLARGAAAGAVSTGAFVATQEAGLQATQPGRPIEQSVHNLETGIVLGSLLGGGLSLLTRGEVDAATRAIQNIDDIQSGRPPETPVEPVKPTESTAGAMEAAPDITTVPRTAEEMAVAGKLAGVVADKTAWLNPVLRSTQRLSAKARQYAANVYESTIYRNLHGQGETTGASAETLFKLETEAALGNTLEQASTAYKAMRKSGVRMNRDAFYNEIGEAMRNGDQHVIPEVAQAAKAFRSLFDRPTKQALELGLIKEKNLDVKTATSYFARVYDRDRLLATEPEFLDTIGEHYGKAMAAEHAADELARDKILAQMETRLADLRLSAAERDTLLSDLAAKESSIKTLYQDIAPILDRLAAIREEMKKATGEGKTALRAEAASLTQQSGPRLKEYAANLKELRGRTKAAQDVKERLARTPEKEVKAREEARIAEEMTKAASRYADRWGARNALADELGRPEAYPFEAAGRATAKEVYDKLTGKVQQLDDVPSFLTRITAGPMRDRTFLVKDSLLTEHGWLKSDAREVAARYLRAMNGEIALTRRFGSVDMRSQLEEIAKEYSDLRVSVAKATSVQEVNSLLGEAAYSVRSDLDKVKLNAQKRLASDERGAIEDIKAGRDLIRGTYTQGANSGVMGMATRSLLHLNYIRVMGGVLIPNLADFVRPAMVHGLAPYLSTLPRAMAQLFGKGGRGLRLSMEEARLAGLIHERVLLSNITSNGAIADPFASSATTIERFLQRASNVASRWNMLSAAIDAQQTIASTISQHRIIQAIMGRATEPGSFVPASQGERLIRMLGIDRETQAHIADLLRAHGERVDGLMIPHTEAWLKSVENATPSVRHEVERAVRQYRSAVNMDVHSVVSRRGLGDAPLMANHPIGKLMTQFMGFTFGAHSRVMLRGMQEEVHRFVGGMAALATVGAFASVLASFRGGRERFDRYMDTVTKNPGVLIADGLDRSGIFPLLFDLSNRTEKLTGAMGYEYRVNPLKSPIVALGGGNPVGVVTSRASDSSGAFSALLGPTAGMLDSTLAAGRLTADALSGKPSSRHDKNTALSFIPYNSYLGARELIQLLTGDSPYMRH